ncbi:MAG TPA: hypothetical protein VKY74_00980 [Chloroflexia bacterium]|nr:hypothetical protein [Chloroflexia bacterium]
MDHSPPGPAGLGHVGQVVFAADGRARAVVWAGQRYAVAGDPATQQAIGQAARAANLYIDPATLQLFDHQHHLLGQCARP